MGESFGLTHHFIVKIHTYRQGNMFQLQRSHHQAWWWLLCSWNMLPWQYVCIL